MIGLINTTKNRGNLYSQLTAKDDVTKLKPLLEKKGYRIGPDGRWRRSYGAQWNTPWIHQHQEDMVECELWHELFFPIHNMVPTYCQNCWKVVVFIPTVSKLFDLYELQKDLEHPCKCGIEYRFTDERKYGGYFYNWGRQAGEACYKKVRQAVDDRLGEDIKVILKCSCSEYEIACGPPDDWSATERQIEIEEAFRRRVVTNNTKYHQFEYIQAYVMLKWIHHACHIGDETYKEFTGGEPLTVTMKTYHDELKEKENGEMAK